MRNQLRKNIAPKVHARDSSWNRLWGAQSSGHGRTYQAVRYRLLWASSIAPSDSDFLDADHSSQRHENPLTEQDKLRHLEAVLFLSPQGIHSRRAAKLAGLADATEVRTLIRQLNRLYDGQVKPYRIEEIAGGFAILTRACFAPWLRKLSYLPGEVRLGRSALETLAIVAYRQPVLRADIEAIRGVGCSETLKQLMEMDLVRICGRSEDLGRPYLYSTTQSFLQLFGLRSVDRLPTIDHSNHRTINPVN